MSLRSILAEEGLLASQTRAAYGDIPEDKYNLVVVNAISLPKALTRTVPVIETGTKFLAGVEFSGFGPPDHRGKPTKVPMIRVYALFPGEKKFHDFTIKKSRWATWLKSMKKI